MFIIKVMLPTGVGIFSLASLSIAFEADLKIESNFDIGMGLAYKINIPTKIDGSVGTSYKFDIYKGLPRIVYMAPVISYG
jgi:hypothetical protein